MKPTNLSVGRRGGQTGKGKRGKLTALAFALAFLLGSLNSALPALREQAVAPASLWTPALPWASAGSYSLQDGKPRWLAPTASTFTSSVAATGATLAIRPVAEHGAALPSTTDRELQAELEEYLASRDGTYGVALRNLETGETVLINADETFRSASTYKLLVMYEVYRQVAAGELAMDDTITIRPADAVEGDPANGLAVGDTVTVAEALRAMITVSSNSAAYALVRNLGGWHTLARAAGDLGMANTGFDAEYFLTTPADMLTFLVALGRGGLVSEAASNGMLNLLRRQTVNDRIPALLPSWVTVAHKTGELPGVRNDVGIVEVPEGRFALAVFSLYADEDEATRVIAGVARRAFDRYAR